jgi:hypothetical protein
MMHLRMCMHGRCTLQTKEGLKPKLYAKEWDWS